MENFGVIYSIYFCSLHKGENKGLHVDDAQIVFCSTPYTKTSHYWKIQPHKQRICSQGCNSCFLQCVSICILIYSFSFFFRWNGAFVIPLSVRAHTHETLHHSERSLNRSRRRRGRSLWWSSPMWTGGLALDGPNRARNRLRWWNPTSAATAARSTTVSRSGSPLQRLKQSNTETTGWTNRQFV